MKKGKMTKNLLFFSFAVLIILIAFGAIVSCENVFVTSILPSRVPKNAEVPQKPEIPVTPTKPQTYAIVIDISGNESGDTVTVSPNTGNEGNTVTLTYTVADTAYYNLLDFGGVTSEIASANGAGNGTRTYAINARDSSSGVITITAVFTHTNLTIDPIAFDDTEGHIIKTYGDAVFSNAVTDAHRGGGAITYSSGDMTVAAVDNYGQVTVRKAGSTVITAEKAADAVYAHAQANYTLTVNPKPVTIIGLTADVKFYDGTTAATVTGTAVIDGLVDGDDVTIIEGTAEFEDESIGDDKIVTFSGWSLGGADAGNYTLSAQPADVTAGITNLIIDPIAFADAEGHITKTYGDAAFTNAVTTAHKGSGAIAYSSSDIDVATVNGSGRVTILKAGSAVITAEKAADAVYANAQTGYTLTVAPKPVTITGLSANSKTYDGRTTATVTGTAVISGLVGGDVVTVNAGTAAFANKTVGTGKAVTFSGYSLDGADCGNYTLSAQPAGVTANITVKSVTVTVNVNNKVYDGTVTATGTAAVNGKIDGDNVNASGTAVFADANAGTGKRVNFSGWSLTGADAGNYSLSTQPASVTANITKAPGATVGKTSDDGVSSNSITAFPLSPPDNGQTVEYAVSTANNGTGISSWQTTTGAVYFTGLNPNTTYYVYARSAENANYTAGPISVSAGIKTYKISGAAVSKPSEDGFSSNSITVFSVSLQTATGQGVEYAISKASNGTGLSVWQSGTTFTGLSPNTTYYVYARSAENANYAAGTRNVSVGIKTDSLIQMVQIPAGTFQMGSPTGEPNRYSEETQHSVTLSSFKMGKYQVTQALYQAVMGTNPSYFTSAVTGESGTPGKLPVEKVSWYDALVFCNKLSVMEGLSPAYRINGSTDPTAWGTVPTSGNSTWDAVQIVSGSTGYRLPTEAQWEYACRAGTTTAYNTGATISDNTGWYTSNSGTKTHEVGKKPANAWGLYDMHGNVWEWCWDWYSSSYYSSSPPNDPMGASSGTLRVLRGGGWGYSAENLRSALRSYSYPNSRSDILGFRLVRP